MEASNLPYVTRPMTEDGAIKTVAMRPGGRRPGYHLCGWPFLSAHAYPPPSPTYACSPKASLPTHLPWPANCGCHSRPHAQAVVQPKAGHVSLPHAGTHAHVALHPWPPPLHPLVQVREQQLQVRAARRAAQQRVAGVQRLVVVVAGGRRRVRGG